MTKLVRANYQPPTYITPKIFLAFNLEKDNTTVTGTIQYKLLNGKPGDALVLHGGKFNQNEFNQGKTKFISATINGVSILESMQESFENEFQIFTIPNVPTEGELVITTQIDPWNNDSCEGLYLSDQLLITQCESQSFRKIIPYIDRPDNLAIFTVEITANEREFPVLLSNGNLITQTRLADQKHKVVYEDPFPKPSYLFALVAGNLACIRDQHFTKSGRKINLFVHVKTDLIGKATLAMQALKEAMVWDENEYDLEYDLENCHLVGASSFNAGAMENKGLIIFNDKCLISDPRMSTDDDQKYIYLVVAHEYFHNYAGNRVTVREWLELALKEGLATKKETDFSADKFGYADKRIDTIKQLRSSQFAEDAGPLAHAVRPDEVESIDNIYTDTIYEKGAELLSMLSRMMGRKLFTEGVKHYFKVHDGCAVTIEDFIRAQEHVSGRNLQQFLEWYKHPGTPKIEFYENYNEIKKEYILQIRQSNLGKDGTELPAFHIPIAIGLLGSAGQDIIPTRLIELTKKFESFVFENINEKPVPSLLRDFTAPVIVTVSPLHTEQHAILFVHDTDPINRWMSGQTLKLAIIKQFMFEYEWRSMDSSTILDEKSVNHALETFTKCCRYILQDNDLDLGMKVNLLEIPYADELISEFKTVNVDALVYAVRVLKSHIGTTFYQDWFDLYEESIILGCDELTQVNADRRRIQGLALEYMFISEQETGVDMAITQFSSASNMTSQLSALFVLTNEDYHDPDNIAQNALSKFYEQWKNNDLVILKWFKVIASSQRHDALDNLERLFFHPAFDIKKPNHLYATVGHFARTNLKHFHNAEGRGYELVIDKIIELEKFNPGVAANIIDVFANWKKFDKHRQKLMVGQLLRVSNLEHVSLATKESVTKILEGITQVPDIVDRSSSANFYSPMFDSMMYEDLAPQSFTPFSEQEIEELNEALKNTI